MKNRALYALLLLLFVKAIVLGLFIHSGMVGLGPDEAQYWTWSQHLDWGYYSKPPAIAWIIWLSTSLFGDTELGVRMPSLLIGFALPLLLFAMAKACRLNDKTAFWSAALLALSPLSIMGSLLAITDNGMVFFWVLACYVIIKALAEERSPSYLTVGFMVLCGALFKWPTYLLWVALLPFMYFFPLLRHRSYLWGIALSLLGLLPSLWWNWQHDWATFQHVITTVAGGHGQEIGTTPLSHGNFFDFLGSQIVLIGPITFFLWIFALIYMRKNKLSITPPVLLCGLLPLLIFSAYSFASLFQKIQGNWCDFAYPTAFIFTAAVMCDDRLPWGKKGMAISVTLSTILITLVFSVPFLQSYHLLPIPYKLNAFRHNVGWSTFKHSLIDSGYDPEKDFLFGDKYQTTSILSFYGPLQKRAYFFNLQGTRKNQFSYWPGLPEEQLGQTGYFIYPENMPYLARNPENQIQRFQQQLAPYFKKVEFLGIFPLFTANGETVKGYYLFKCEDFLGQEPKNPDLY